MEKQTNIYTLTIGGRDYKAELTREALKTGDSLGVLTDIGDMRRISLILYVSLMKHHPFMTLKKAEQLVDTALDEGYCLGDFSVLVDEYTAWYKAVFTRSEKQKKPLLQLQNSAK